MAHRFAGIAMLLDHIDAYMRQTKTSPSRFGRDALGDPHFVDSVRNGRKVRAATARRVIAYIAAADSDRT